MELYEFILKKPERSTRACTSLLYSGAVLVSYKFAPGHLDDTDCSYNIT